MITFRRDTLFTHRKRDEIRSQHTLYKNQFQISRDLNMNDKPLNHSENNRDEYCLS